MFMKIFQHNEIRTWNSTTSKDYATFSNVTECGYNKDDISKGSNHIPCESILGAKDNRRINNVRALIKVTKIALCSFSGF